MSATQVTIGQFKKFAAGTGYQSEAEKANEGSNLKKTYLDPRYTVTDDSPATVITWNDAVAYCQWLSSQEKRTYRLPTEAEWEYACRAGTTTQYSFGDDKNELPRYGWYDKNSRGRSHAVGTLLPNNFGLFDMHGNLYDWCSDWYDEKWYEKSSSIDPIGPPVGSQRVHRGGHLFSDASACRSAFRSAYSPSHRHHIYGFRVVRVADATVDSQLAPNTKTQPTTPVTSVTAQPSKSWESAVFQAWVKATQALPAEQQIEAVSKKLMELIRGLMAYWGEPM